MPTPRKFENVPTPAQLDEYASLPRHSPDIQGPSPDFAQSPRSNAYRQGRQSPSSYPSPYAASSRGTPDTSQSPYAGLSGRGLGDNQLLSPEAASATDTFWGRRGSDYMPAPSFISRDSTHESLQGPSGMPSNRNSWGSGIALAGAAGSFAGAEVSLAETAPCSCLAGPTRSPRPRIITPRHWHRQPLADRRRRV